MIERREPVNSRKLHLGIFFLALIVIFLCSGYQEEVFGDQQARLAGKPCKVIKIISGKYTSVYDSGPNCTSPDKVCTRGTITEAGILNGTFYVTVLKIAPSAGLKPIEPSSTLAYVGDVVLTAKQGMLTLRCTGLSDKIEKIYTTIYRMTSGTGIFEGASGLFYSSGIWKGDGFEGKFWGELCLLEKADDD